MHVKDFSSENYCEHCLYNITRRGLMVKMDVKLLAYFPLNCCSTVVDVTTVDNISSTAFAFFALHRRTL